MVRAGPGYLERAQAMSPGTWEANHITPEGGSWGVQVPGDYFPKIDKVGQPSNKVYIADGVRYADYKGGNTTFDYSVNASTNKGAFVATPPCTLNVNQISHSREYVYGWDESWRHGYNDSIQAGFFDGHVATLSATRTTDFRKATKGQRWSGEAVHPKYYYPQHTKILEPNMFHRNDLRVGFEIP
jgi:hypothetical protein